MSVWRQRAFTSTALVGMAATLMFIADGPAVRWFGVALALWSASWGVAIVKAAEEKEKAE